MMSEHTIDEFVSFKSNGEKPLLIAALIFSAGYYSAPIFYFVEQKNVSLYFILPLFQHFT